MTASEYVGHVDDINSEYDMIYIGDSLNESSRDIRINGTKPMLYTHVGGAINLNDIHTGSGSNDIRKLSLMGMLDIDYVIGTDGKKRYVIQIYIIPERMARHNMRGWDR